MEFVRSNGYRKDIDGLRAIAVVAVILYHFGLLPNGYLGVDVFFVISGYLITRLIVREVDDGTFSLGNFYTRRVRRILPLTLFVTLVALVGGLCVMLPDDLENLAQSVVATNLFGNNILLSITTRDYWDVVNDYKPLMHTWSLAVEEQYYLLYPPFLLLVVRSKRKLLFPAVAALTLASVVLYFVPFEAHTKFYYLPFRLFELSLGGLVAIGLGDRVVAHRFAPALIALLIFLLLL